MFSHSGLLDQLQHARTPNGEPICLYGDPAYTLRVHSQVPFWDNLNPLQEDFNFQMSKVQISAEWLISEIIKYFAFPDFKNNLKISLSLIGKMYRVCALLTNARTSLYKT